MVSAAGLQISWQQAWLYQGCPFACTGLNVLDSILDMVETTQMSANDVPILDAGKLQRVEEERQHLLEMSTANAEHAASLESQLHTAEAQLSSTRQTLAESREVAERQLQASQSALTNAHNCYWSASF